MTGAGSTKHNERAFIAENVDKDRVQYNIEYCNEKIWDVYQKLFGEALEKYNAKQTRKDRRIENYYEKIRTGKQENPFEEVIVQVGDKDTMGAMTENGQLAKQILDEYMKGFQDRNLNLYVFSAHLHMDEATPHLHIDFIPFITESKRGLETRVSFKGALEKQGFKGGTRNCTERNEWYESEKEALSKIMLEHGIEWEKKGTHEKHKSVSQFKRDKLIEEVETLEEEKSALEDKISTYKNAEEYAMVTARKAVGNENFEIPSPTLTMSVKAYKTKLVEPFVKRLIEFIQGLARRCYRAEKLQEESAEKITTLQKEKEDLKTKVWDLKVENTHLKKELKDFEKIKAYIGIDKIKELLQTIADKTKKQKEL